MTLSFSSPSYTTLLRRRAQTALASAAWTEFLSYSSEQQLIPGFSGSVSIAQKKVSQRFDLSRDEKKCPHSQFPL
jgi:hypothetical protein